MRRRPRTYLSFATGGRAQTDRQTDRQTETETKTEPETETATETEAETDRQTGAKAYLSFATGWGVST